MRKLKDSYIISLVLLSMIIVACSSGIESSEKIEEIEIEESASPVESAPIEMLPPIIKTPEVSDFLTVQLTSEDFRNFNSDSVRYRDDPNRFLIDINRQDSLTLEYFSALDWGLVDKFLPEECEYESSPINGTTQRFVESENITGMLFARDKISAGNANWSRAKLTEYRHKIIVWNNFEISKNVWEAKLGSFSTCRDGYDVLLNDGTVENYNYSDWISYTNSENNLLLEYYAPTSRRTDAFVVSILQGGIHHYFDFKTGYQMKKGGSFSFLEELIQKSLDEASKTQSLETFQLNLDNLSTFNPEDFTFNKPNLGSGGSV